MNKGDNNHYINASNTFFPLIRLGIGHHADIVLEEIDWSAMKALADEQGLLAVMLDGIEKLPEEIRPPQKFSLQLIGEVMQGYELRYEMYRRAITKLAAFYTSYGFRMMVLKGCACSINWPKPEHRPCGDIDIWLYGDYKEADAVLRKEKGIEINNARQHHTVFDWHGFMVENHYDFTNLHHHKSNGEIEKILKDLGNKSTETIDIYGQKVYIPSPNMHTLFLLKHAMAHFAAEGMTLRQLLDWGFYVKAHTNEIDWRWLGGVLNKYGMTPAYNIFNAICVEDLGFDATIFPNVQCSPFLKEKVINEILDPEFTGPLPKGLLPRIFYKVKRWRSNTWKHELCYNDSLRSAFRCGVWNHLRKPATI